LQLDISIICELLFENSSQTV